MKSSIRREYRSVELDAKHLADLAEYLDGLSEEPAEYKIGLKGGENFSTDNFTEFQKELEFTKNWRHIEEIIISQQDRSKGLRIYMVFRFSDFFLSGYSLSVKGGERSQIVGITSEIEKRLQLSTTKNWLFSARVYLESVLVLFPVSMVAGYIVGRYYYDFVSLTAHYWILLWIVATVAFTPRFGLARLYPRVVMHDKALAKSSGRLLQKDTWKIVGVVAPLAIAIAVDIIRQ